jgi:hypothetical protein
MTFAMTFPPGTHAMWMRYWLAAGGIHPGYDSVTDSNGATNAQVQLSVTPPPQMPSYVKLRRNEWTRGAQPKPRSKAHSSVCECEPPPEFAAAAAASAAAAAAAAGDGDGAPAAKKARAAKPPTARLGCGGECQNRLTSPFCDSRTCPCGAACSNRPFHLLPLPRTKPFLTACGRGWGLKAAQLIPAGSFVVEYIGEILDDAQCGARLAADKEAGETNFYMMEVARNHVIDARYKGNVSRLINSSCAPNCETQRWVDGASGETRVGIFTLRDVQPGEELTCVPHQLCCCCCAVCMQPCWSARAWSRLLQQTAVCVC